MPPTTAPLLETLRNILAEDLELAASNDLATLIRTPQADALPFGPIRDAAPWVASDLKDFQGYAQRLLQRADPVSAFLHDQLPPATLAALQVLAAQTVPADRLAPARENLLTALNNLLDRPDLWNEARFDGIRLRPKTRRLRDMQATGAALRQLNKRLIEDAYPLELRRNDPHRFWLREPSTPLRFRVAERLDLTADALVVDHELGTLALVHIVVPPDPATQKTESPTSPDDIGKHLRQRIGEAAYLRHLLLEDLRPGETQHRRSPFAVEVVFVITDPALSRSFGEQLRSVTRDVSLLHAIGVNLLEPRSPTPSAAPAEPTPPSPRYQASDIHRAFSWLLCKSREWMTSQLPSSSAKSTPSGSATTQEPLPTGLPSMVLLKNFRLRGSRRWQLRPGRSLHLVHGHNGSGKSSFVEAIELITTGRIEKLGPADCQSVITNRTILAKRKTNGPVPRAAVQLQFPAPTPAPAPSKGSARSSASSGAVSRLASWRLTPTGVDRPLAPEFASRSGAFRLNQDVIKLLSRSSDKEQAKLLLETFFPEGYALASESQQALRQRDQTLAKLPSRLRKLFETETGTYDESRATDALSWVQGPSIPWNRVLQLLPLDTSQLHALQPLLPLTLQSHLERTGDATSWEPVFEAAKAIDEGIRTLLNRSASLLNSIRAAQTFLSAYQDVAIAAPEESTGALPDLFHHWLQQLATADILKREHALLATVEAVQHQLPAAFPPDQTPFLAAPEVLSLAPAATSRTSRWEAAEEQLRSARGKVVNFVSPSERTRLLGSPAPALGEFDLGALDAVAEAGGFGRDLISASPKLSEAVRLAFQSGQPVTVQFGNTSTLSIGAPGGFRTLAAGIEGVATALLALESARTEFVPPDGGLHHTLTQFQILQQIAQRQQSLLANATASFRTRLQTPLGAALNEFTAMLTPARWAYDDIISRVDDTDASISLDFVQDNQPAPLRLNTAQISTFALAFFLLCNRAREHPLRLGILDDPFENMDELTVTTVARGLGRFLRLSQRLGDGPNSWQLLLFLHGEQDMERIRREIPCATYFLPWLSPGAVLGKERPITADKTEILGDTLQDLIPILSEIRPTVAAKPRPLAP